MLKTKKFFELLWEMTQRELRARYKYTILGFLWIVLNPVLQMLIIGFVFKFFMRETIQNYYYFLFVGLLVWNFFSISLSKATPSIVYERSLIKKAMFAHSIIPLAIILANFIHLMVAIFIVSIPILLIGTMSFESLIYIVLALVLLIAFTIGTCLLSSSLNVKFRDVNFFVQAYIMFWFYATPIIYPLSIVPFKYYWLWRFNPMTSILQLLQHGFLDMPLPGIVMVTTNTVVIIAILVMGITSFNRQSRDFDDWV